MFISEIICRSWDANPGWSQQISLSSELPAKDELGGREDAEDEEPGGAAGQPYGGHAEELPLPAARPADGSEPAALRGAVRAAAGGAADACQADAGEQRGERRQWRRIVRKKARRRGTGAGD